MIRFLIDGIALCVFFSVLTCWWNLTTRPASTALLLSLPNSVCIATYDLPRGLMHLHCDASQRMICWELSCACIVPSRSDGNHQNMVCLSIFQGRLAMFRKFDIKTQCKRDETCQFKEEGQRDSRQVRFSLDNSIWFLITLGSPKLHFYRNTQLRNLLQLPYFIIVLPTKSHTKLWYIHYHWETRLWFLMCTFQTQLGIDILSNQVNIR